MKYSKKDFEGAVQPEILDAFYKLYETAALEDGTFLIEIEPNLLKKNGLEKSELLLLHLSRYIHYIFGSVYIRKEFINFVKKKEIPKKISNPICAMFF